MIAEKPSPLRAGLALCLYGSTEGVSAERYERASQPYAYAQTRVRSSRVHLGSICHPIRPKAKAHTVKYHGLQGLTIQGGICCSSHRLKELPLVNILELVLASYGSVMVVD